MCSTYESKRPGQVGFLVRQETRPEDRLEWEGMNQVGGSNVEGCDVVATCLGFGGGGKESSMRELN
jgi:hypothetical protein